MAAQPTADDVEQVILAARYGDAESEADIHSFIQKFGIEKFENAVDDSGNSALHMAAANGHTSIVKFILEKTSKPTYMTLQNTAGNTALHWSALNAQLEVLRVLAPLLSQAQLLMENSIGKIAYDLAESRNTEQSLECAGYLLGLMPETAAEKEQASRIASAETSAADEAVEGVQDLKISQPASEITQIRSPER